MKKLGQTYRHLRKEQGITLAIASKGICSSSNLSRWENGQIELDFNIVIQLLNRIHIDTNEFLTYNDFSFDDQNFIPEEVMAIINNKKTALIPDLLNKYLDKYHQDKNIFYLYIAIIIANQYQIIKGKNILPLADQVHLFNYLSKINLWSQFNITFFTNSVFLIDSAKIYALAMQIIHNFDFNENQKVILTLIAVLGGLGDAIIALILKDDLSHAKKLLHNIEEIAIPTYLSFYTLTWKNLHYIIHYVETGDEQPILQFIDTVIKLGMRENAELYLDVFKQVKEHLAH